MHVLTRDLDTFIESIVIYASLASFYNEPEKMPAVFPSFLIDEAYVLSLTIIKSLLALKPPGDTVSKILSNINIGPKQQWISCKK